MARFLLPTLPDDVSTQAERNVERETQSHPESSIHLCSNARQRANGAGRSTSSLFFISRSLEVAPLSGTNGGQEKVAVVIEDDEVTRNLLATLLQEEGFRAVTVADGTQALQVIERLKPTLVTLDLSLPGKSGVEILIELWEKQLSKVVPVIVVSATSAHLPLSIRALAHSVIDKPFSLDELLGAVERATDGRRGKTAAPHSRLA